MKISEINKKIRALQEMQNSVVNSLIDAAENINGNNLISQEEIKGLTDSLSLLVGSQRELIDDLKSLMGNKFSSDSAASQYKTLLNDGSAYSLLANIELEKFFSITSDNSDFKEAIVKLQNEIKESDVHPLKEGYAADIISMVNKAVESQEEFAKIKTELFNELKQRYLMVYTGLFERGYRFGKAAAEDVQVSPTDDIEQTMPKIPVADEKTQEDELTGENATASEQTEINAETKATTTPVKWAGNVSKMAIKKWLGDFLEKDTRTGKWYPTSHFHKLKPLEDLHFFGFLTQETYEKIIGKPNVDWLLLKGYIAKTVAPVSGFNVISLSNKGAAVLNNDAVKGKLYGREGLKDKQILTSASEQYKDESEERIVRILSVGETAAALIASADYPFNRVIDFSYSYIILKFLVEDKIYGVCLCSGEELDESGHEELSASFEEMDKHVVLTCAFKHAEGGNYINEIEALDENNNGFTIKMGEESLGAAEYLKAFVDAANLPTEPAIEELVAEETAITDCADTNDVPNELFLGVEVLKAEKKPKDYEGESVETLCKNILNDGLSPKDNSREFYVAIMKLIAENRMWDAIFFLENLAYESDEFKGIADNLKYVANIHKWSSNSYSALENNQLPQVIDNYPFVADAIKLARSLHCLAFFESNDYVGVPNARSVSCETLAVSSLVAPCKALLNELSILSKQSINEGGYTETEISAIVNAQATINDFKKKADSLIAHPYKGKLEPLLKPTFQKDKPLLDCLNAVKNNELSAYETVKSIMGEYFNKADGLSLVKDKEKIEIYIDRIWEIAKKLDPNKKNEALKFDAREQSVEYLSERVDFINEWLVFCKTKLNGQSHKVTHRTQIIDLTKKICDTYISDSEEIAAANIIKFAAQRIGEFLSGKFFDEAWFAPVLCTNEFLLDENYLPEDLSCFAVVNGLEPWRSAVRHFSQRGTSVERAVENIEVRKEKDWQGNNYSHKLLCNYLKKDYAFLIDTVKIKPQAEIEKKKFEARMETDFLYGRIDETEKESFFAAERVLFGYMVEKHSELGKYKKFLNILTSRVDDIVQVKTVEFEKQIKELEKQYPDAPILDNIKSELNKKNFIVAEEYITLLQGGIKEIDKELAEQDDSNSDLEKFLALYEDIYKVANSPVYKREADFSKWAKTEYAKFNKKYNHSPTISDAREAEAYFDSWKGEGKSKAEKLLIQLGFNVENTSIEAKKSQFCDECYKLKVSPVPLTRSSYSHPIGAFGTDCKSINVLCFYGENKADRVVKAVESLNPRGAATIVIFNAALNKTRREGILKEFKQTSQANSFLLIDYVLGFYLALVSKGKRLNALLQCSVPYTGYKLFSDSVDTLLPEMFIGREQEINKITDLGAPVSLVYGGRQLGKTALFRRACAMMNDPREGKYAIYVSVAKTQTDGDNFFVEKVSEELIRCQLIPNKEYKNNEEICKALREKVCRTDTEYLYLFIDEVNDYFEQLNERQDTSELNSFVELKRVSNKRFKFVLAGLHHVQRYSEFYKNNSVVGQMTAPMLVKPLSRIEAIRLIDYPFSYLGINIDQSFTALIAARANYYPGNIQMICREIVETVQRSTNKPPYTVDDKLLEAVCGSSEINKEIRKKINLTLELDPAYKAIAMLFVFNYYDDKANNRITVDGYSANQILQMAKEWQKTAVSHLSLRELETLLDELANMSILRTLENKSDKAIKTYKLRKSSLAEQIATRDELENYLLGDE